MATCEDGLRTRGAGSGREVVFRACKTWGNRGNIGIAPPPDPSCQRFAQSGGWRLTLGHMVGNVKVEPIPPFSKCAILLVFVAQSTSHRCKSYVGFLFSASMGLYTPKNTKMTSFF